MHEARVFHAPEDDWGTTTLHGERVVKAVPDVRGRTVRTKGERGHLTYAPGLDGVRALAVTAVVVFHLGATWLAGGFLGVDVFFTLSGFLITSILLAEFVARGHVDIKRFYLRRARRLLPALFTMLAGVTVLTWLFARDELHRLRGDVVAALTYSTNWTQIAWNRGYFAQLGRPSLLQHLWSLAVEEQFYLIWPLILVVCLTMRRRWRAIGVPVVLIGVSLLLMALMYHAGQDPSRVYYGSDTHISPMLIGAALAMVVGLRRRAARDADAAGARVVADVASVAGFAVLAWACVHVNFYTAGLYRGGYLLIGLAAAAVIYAAARPRTLTATVLGWAPLVWIGQRSYAIYLWHWPILMLSRPGIDVTWPKPLVLAMQVAATLFAADLSFRYVERPIRTNGFMATLRGVTRVRPGVVRTALIAAVALVAATLGTAGAAPAGVEVDKGPRTTIAVPTTPSPFARPIRVSFFGDSQGMTLLLNKPNGLQKTFRLTDSTVEGCGVLLGTITSRTGYTRDLSSECGSWPRQWAANAAKNTPQIAVVEIGAWDVFDDTLHGTKLSFGSAALERVLQPAAARRDRHPHRRGCAGRAARRAVLPADSGRRLTAVARARR